MNAKSLVRRMLTTDKGFRFRQVMTIADHFGLEYRDGPDRTFYRAGCLLQARIPRHPSKEIDPVYIRKFRELIYDLVPEDWR
jgi:hypothetical protein